MLNLFWLASFTQTIHSPAKASIEWVGAYSRRFTTPFSFLSNQAALSSLSQPGAGLFTEQRFLLKDLNFSAMVIALPWKHAGVGFQLTHFGNEVYNESQVGIAYARKLGALCDIGLQFDYFHIGLSGYGSFSAITFEAGVVFHPAENIHFGMHLYNPAGGMIGKSGREKLAYVYSVGIGYEASEQVLISAEIIKEENKPVSVNAGINYMMGKQLFLELGIATAVSSPFAGMGLGWGRLRIAVTVSYRTQLGFNPCLLLLYSFKKPG
jgi:hypothetical protein